MPSIFLTPSVEVLDPTLSFFITSQIPHYSAPDSSHFCVENHCFLGSNGRQLIQYQGSSANSCVGHDISVLSEGAFMLNNSLATLVFKAQSRLHSLPRRCFCNCVRLHWLEVQKLSMSLVGLLLWMRPINQSHFRVSWRIRKIECSAFFYSHQLACFTDPSSVSTLRDSVFSGCSALPSLTVEAPSHLTHIEPYLFNRTLHRGIALSVVQPNPATWINAQ
jgi:hypothetical protein